VRFWWNKAAPGLYYLRDSPAGRGAHVGSVRTTPRAFNAARFYSAVFDYGDLHVFITERGRAETVMDMLENMIVMAFPDATFEREF
jgi:hypothetical protein